MAKSRIDKVRKKELKPHLDVFWEWACAVGPMLPIYDWDYVRRMRAALTDSEVLEGWTYDSRNHYDGLMVQHIIRTYDHELRLPLLTMFMLRSGMIYASTPEDAKKVRAKFNHWANDACGLIKTTKGK